MPSLSAKDSIPHFIMIKDGKPVRTKLGYELRKMIREDRECCPEIVEQGFAKATVVFANKVCCLVLPLHSKLMCRSGWSQKMLELC
jgi:hypothetical protein